MSTSLIPKFVVIMVLTIMTGPWPCLSNMNRTTIPCNEEDREGLIKFKHTLLDPYNLLSSWRNGQDCCKWRGVTCHKVTGRVIKLELHPVPVMPGDGDLIGPDFFSSSPFYQHWTCTLLGTTELSTGLLSLRYLSHLDLSGIWYTNTTVVPSFFGSMKRLKHLQLEGNNARRKRACDGRSLIDDEFFVKAFHSDLVVDDVAWLSHLQALESLKMEDIHFKKPHEFMKVINNDLPFLSHLRMSYSELQNSHISHLNSTFLRQLQYLDLSWNNLGGQISSAFGNMTSIQYLDLSSNNLGGQISSAFGNMTLLHYLDLSWNKFSSQFPIRFGDPDSLVYIDISYNMFEGNISDSLGHLSTLRALDLSYNLLEGNIPDSFGHLSALRVLDLSVNRLEGNILDSFGHLSALRVLDLSVNRLEGNIPDSFGHLSALRVLDLSGNQLEGNIPDSFGHLSTLRVLDLSDNRLEGNIPDSFGHLSALRALDLSGNRLTGTIPITFGQLSNLENLLLKDNSLKGTISESHFVNLSKLEYLHIGQNNLTFIVNSDWVPPFQLYFIGLESCNLENKFPRWIQTQRLAEYLILSDAGINGPFPECLGGMQFIHVLDLSNNLIYGHLPLNISEMLPNLIHMTLSSNSISGTLPLSLCDMKKLSFLDLSKNNLSGRIPDCWKNTSQLAHINLSSNKFYGVIPKSLVYAVDLVSLHLNNNSLSGRLPEYLRPSPWLMLLDLGENNLSGNLPSSIAMNQNLQILRLRGNHFQGIIPRKFCSLYNLKILDLAANNLTGSIPSCFENMDGMKRGQATRLPSSLNTFEGNHTAPIWEIEGVLEVIKGTENEFTKNTKLLVNLDLSSNHLVGPIPEKLVALTGLRGLNFSHNHLSGNIPSNIENLALLESLDLSNNQLSGQIPDGLSSLTALSCLNLANNNLSGHIPQGTQISTIYDENRSIFSGNPYLCGDPLPWKCNDDRTEPPQAPKSTPIMRKREHLSDEFILYIVVALGYGTGFWGIILVLIFKKSWRIACFKFVDEIADKVYVAVLVKLAKYHCR